MPTTVSITIGNEHKIPEVIRVLRDVKNRSSVNLYEDGILFDLEQILLEMQRQFERSLCCT